jgi:tocopherol cyclase
MRKQNLLVAALSALLSLPVIAQKQPADPYNTLIWNRDNAIHHTGRVDVGDWYEWWYYKVIEPESGEAFYFTYGVINPWDQDQSLAGTAATVQVGSFNRKQLVTAHFPVSEFMGRYDKTEVRIGSNLATDRHIQGHVQENGHDVEWDLSVDKKWAFNAMGWATSRPDISNIYWYPAQAAAGMSGWIRLDEKTVRFDHAPAYQDRNWGRSFPKWWTWLTSNGFKNSPNTVLAAGGGEPKLLNSVFLFTGLCIGLFHEGKEYIFRTTDADHIDFQIGWGVWNVSASNSHNQRIEISAYAPPEDFLLLPFPSPRGDLFYDYEALKGKMNVKLYERKNVFADWHLTADLDTDEAGIEWGTPEPVESFRSTSFMSLFQSYFHAD